MIKIATVDNADQDSEQAEVSSDDDVSEPTGAELLIEYLQSERGHQIADRLVSLFEKKVSLTAEKTYKFHTQVLLTQVVVFIVTLGVLTFLSYRAKVDPTLALLIGTLVGYFFGRR